MTKTNRGFHEKAFDDATQTKLEIFKRYLREWIPVFMTDARRGEGHSQREVYLCDFFAEPGRDAAGNPGSPLIVIDELKKYCETQSRIRGNVIVHLLLNDADPAKIESLRAQASEIACQERCCNIEYTAEPFAVCFQRNLPRLHDPSSAKLLIMDQFGIKEITPEVIRQVAECKKADVLFFISSSNIRRFADAPEIQRHIRLSSEEIRDSDYHSIHRTICEHYRSRLPDNYYLAPFSIKKGSNIYGVVFGTSHLLGLEKFLRVCWALDAKTGEANYNIDGDMEWSGQMALLPEDRSFRKVN